jgi:regulator of sigma E protease
MAILLTLLGIGLVLFVHELGHYLAARRAGVHVEVFALGFGPRIAGFRRGGTDYRLSLLPLGGYVLVAGENLEGPPRRGELMAASRRGRLLFYAGGILMNFAFALALLPLLFGIGVPFESPVLGTVEPGGAAWHAGLRANDRITEVDGRAVHGFRHIATAAALSARDAEVVVRGERAGAPFEIAVAPRWDAALDFPSLGVGPAFEVAVVPGSPAARAGLLASDEILAINGLAVVDTAAAQAILEDLAFSPEAAVVHFRRDGAEQELTLTASAAAPGAPQLGVFERQDRVVEVRGALAESLRVGDLLMRAGGSPVQRPVDLLRAALRARSLPALEIVRDGAPLVLPARPDIAPEEIAASLHLGVSDGMRLAVRAGSPADRAGLRDGDAVLRVDTDAVRDFGELRAAIARRVTEAAPDAAPPELVLTVLPAGAERSAVLRVRPEPLLVHEHGLGLRTRSEVVRSANPLRAMQIGLREAWQTATEVMLTLRRMILGELPATNLGGIISIGQVTHGFASQGIPPLLLFLCVVSINLAILNLLPLPGLDGGHMLLLLIETLRRKPVGVRARNAFNLVGFAIVIGLLLFVTTLDVRRLLG